MRIKRLLVGEEETNCYVISENNKAIIIDPGDNSKKIIKYLQKEELEPLAILLTHGHYDHTKAVDNLVNAYNCPCYLDKEDLIFMVFHSKIEGSVTLKTKMKEYHSNMQIGDFHITVCKLPGHTPGSVGIIIENCLFSGDVFFSDGIGRYDLYGSNKHELLQSIEYIKENYKGFICYPGHEESFIIS